MKKIKTLIVVMLTITMLAPNLVGAKDQTSPADLGQPSVKKQTLEPETSKATETQKEKQTSKEKETQKEKKKKLITSPAIQKYEIFKRDYEFDKDNAIEAFWGDVTDEELVEILKYMDKKGEDKGRVLTGADRFWEEAEEIMGEIEKLKNEEVMEKELEKNRPRFDNKMEEVNKRHNRINQIMGKNISNKGGDHGPGDGNALSYKDLEKWAVKGDILLGDNVGKSIQGDINHAGIYNGEASKYNGNVILSAQPGPGVLMESIGKWSDDNNLVMIVTVKHISDEEKAKAYDTVAAVADIGEEYSLLTLKFTTKEWYCSKIPWYAYNNIDKHIDIDADGGIFVSPTDIYKDKDIEIVTTIL